MSKKGIADLLAELRPAAIESIRAIRGVANGGAQRYVEAQIRACSKLVEWTIELETKEEAADPAIVDAVARRLVLRTDEEKQAVAAQAAKLMAAERLKS